MGLFHQRLCPCATLGKLVVLSSEDMLKYDSYQEKSQNADMFLILDKQPEVTSEWWDQYMNEKIFL